MRRHATLLTTVSGLAVLAVLASARAPLFATSSAEITGWTKAVANSTTSPTMTTYTPGGSPLPQEVSIVLNDGELRTRTQGWSHMDPSSAGPMGVPTSTALADITAKGVITTTEATPAFLDWRVQVTYTTAADANVAASYAGSSAVARAFTFLTRTRSLSVGAPGFDTDGKGPAYLRRELQLVDHYWTNVGGGTHTAVFGIPLNSQGAQTYATPGTMMGGGEGAPSAAGAGGDGRAGSLVNVKLTGVSGKSPSSGGTVTATVPSGVVAMFMTIRNASGNLVDDWMIDPYAGKAILDVDNYATGQYTLACRLPGTLVSKVVLNHDPVAVETISPVWRFGDLDGDNYVSQAEVDFVQAHLGTNVTMSNMNAFFPDDPSPYVPHDADFNGDGMITQADLNLATPNVGLHGD